MEHLTHQQNTVGNFPLSKYFALHVHTHKVSKPNEFYLKKKATDVFYLNKKNSCFGKVVHVCVYV